MELLENTLLKNGEYRIIRRLGKGGFGITYLAMQTGLERYVVVKEFFLSEYCARDRDASTVTLGAPGAQKSVVHYLHKFLKEARCIAALKHPNVISIHDVFEENNTAYYVMEYHKGGSLGNDVDKNGAMSEERALRYIRQVAVALEFVHGHKTMHLDIKPDNILLDADDNVVLIDFGLAKVYSPDGQNQGRTTLNIAPKSSITAYSPGYAPIEQYHSSGVTAFCPATDIYSLGATLFTLLTGSCPPLAIDIPSNGSFLDELSRKGVSMTTIAVIKKSMSFMKEDRPQSIAEFLSLFNRETEVCEDVDELFERGVAAYDCENYKEAVEWFAKAAKLNHIDAQCLLALSYTKGDGVEVDAVEAARWWRTAAEQGEAMAQYELGVCFEKGLGVRQSLYDAKYWFSKAASQGRPDAVEALSRLSREESKPVAKSGNRMLVVGAAIAAAVAVCINVYIYFANGTPAYEKYYTQGVNAYKDKRYAEAVQCWKKSADAGFAGAQYNLAVCYTDGTGVEKKNAAKAAELYASAAGQGHVQAQNSLGVCYEYGLGVKKDPAKAVAWYLKSAEQGNAEARNNLANCYYSGKGVDQNYAEAAKWWLRAAENGNVVAQYIMGICNEKGIGVSKDISESRKWYRMAANQGHSNAKKALERID